MPCLNLPESFMRREGGTKGIDLSVCVTLCVLWCYGNFMSVIIRICGSLLLTFDVGMGFCDDIWSDVE